jgi:uncharacterized protein DUF3489
MKKENSWNNSATPMATTTAKEEIATTQVPKRTSKTRSGAATTRSAPTRGAPPATKADHKAPVARRGTKTAKILALLQRPDGASITGLKKATGWQAHSVRGFLSEVLKKKLGLRVASTKRENGERSYRVHSK